MSGLAFINALNETYMTPVPDLAAYWDDLTGPGWEALSPTGEIRAFATRADAHTWRVTECLRAIGAPLAVCECEHADHFDDEPYGAPTPRTEHAYMAAPAGHLVAHYVGAICDACASGHLAEYVAGVAA